MKKIAGYLNLKPINGIIFPSNVQNQLNKEFIETKLKSSFFMTTNENTYGENSIVLKSLITLCIWTISGLAAFTFKTRPVKSERSCSYDSKRTTSPPSLLKASLNTLAPSIPVS